MVVDSLLPHAECGPNDHRKDEPPFIFKNYFRVIFLIALSFTYVNVMKMLCKCLFIVLTITIQQECYNSEHFCIPRHFKIRLPAIIPTARPKKMTSNISSIVFKTYILFCMLNFFESCFYIFGVINKDKELIIKRILVTFLRQV